MLGNYGRSITQAVFTPVARALRRLHVTPNVVTVVGTTLSCAAAVGFLARGYLWQGTVVLAILLLLDSLDGILARTTGQATVFGAFLDSTLDRVTDGFVFGSLLWWAIMGLPDSDARTVAIISGIVVMTAAGTVPYARARAEAIGVVAKGGIAERADRLVVALGGAALFGLGLSVWFFSITLALVAFTSAFTVGQRVVFTYRKLSQVERNTSDGTRHE